MAKRAIRERATEGPSPSPVDAGGKATAKKQKRQSQAKRANKEGPGERLIAQNRKARHDYTVLDALECGIVLVGSEVKSLRAGKVSLDEAYGRMRNGEVWLVGCDIPEYVEANRFNHLPRRPRKLLLHRREIRRFAAQAYQRGLTLVPLKMYFKQGRAKLLLGLCRGRQHYDKRAAMKKAEAKRDVQRAMLRR
ncbi:MAG: SsrA-binding protein SmpB [Planctomycetota bacterium]|jgi:SsrA-binding protein